MKCYYQITFFLPIVLLFVSMQSHSDSIGIYGQPGIGAAIVPKLNRTPKNYSDTAYYKFFQAGFLYDSNIVEREKNSHRISLGYETKTRNLNGVKSSQDGYGVSYAYLAGIKQWQGITLWIGPAVRVVFYENTYNLLGKAVDNQEIMFGYGPIIGMNHKYNNLWTLSYYIEASNLDAFFTDLSNPDKEGRTLSLQISIALLYSTRKLK